MAAATALVVDNYYYNQPLLVVIEEIYGVLELQISSLSMLTKIKNS